MNFSKTTHYALKILHLMATDKQDVFSGKYLHDQLGIPLQYLRQLLASLSKNGFIKSHRGRSGGFVFSKDTKEIYIADIIDSIEGLEAFNKCFLNFEKCPFNNPCAMHDTWQESRKKIIKVLKTTSIENFSKIDN
jgi:Rrf2 family protein